MKLPVLSVKGNFFSSKEIKKKCFPVAGIASMGGPEAVIQFLENISSFTGIAFIYIQQLNSEYNSLLTKLLSMSTTMKVQEAENMMDIQPNNFYIIPSDKQALLVNGHIQLTPHKKNGLSDSTINSFFRSLGDQFKKDSIGVILSGGVTDDTIGIRTIKNKGGLTFAQDKSLEFTGSCKSAIAEDIIDFVLSPKEIAQELTRHSKYSYMKQNKFQLNNKDEIDNNHNDLKIILNLIQNETDSGKISVEVAPLKEWDDPLLLGRFTDREQVETTVEQSENRKNTSILKDQKIKKLEEELATAYANIRSIREDHEASSEKMQLANEELQRANKKLETSNQKLQNQNELLAESYNYAEVIIANIPMIILDKYLHVKFANKPFYEKFQITQEETEGIPFYELGNKQWKIPELCEVLEDTLPANAPIQNLKLTHIFHDMGEKTMLINIQRITKKNSREQLILLAITDITEPSDQSLRADNLKLRNEAKEKTKEIEQEKENLKEKNIELKNMSNELTSFAYIASHDLQEPLRKIQIFATRILENEYENLSENGKELFKRMQESAKRTQVLINDLLSYSRTSVTEQSSENTCLHKIVMEVKDDLKDIIREKQAIIETKKLCEISINPFQLRQIIYNLIDNSLKFSKAENSPHIIISSDILKGDELNNKKLLLHKQYYHISISDNGIGFHPQYKDRIFEVFQRLHDRDKYTGTGIGLAICKKIIENYNGIITATSQLNKGATFDIYIPVAE